MAETEITVQAFGETPNYVAANADGHFYVNDGESLVLVENFSGGDVVCTHVEDTSKQCDYQHDPVDPQATCSTGGVTSVWGAKHRYRFNDTAGKAHFTLDVVTTVRVAVISYKAVG